MALRLRRQPLAIRPLEFQKTPQPQTALRLPAGLRQKPRQLRVRRKPRLVDPPPQVLARHLRCQNRLPTPHPKPQRALRIRIRIRQCKLQRRRNLACERASESRRLSRSAATPFERNDSVAEAERYIYGRGEAQDCDHGVRLLKTNAQQSNAKAMISLGALYSTGTCTPRDLPTAYR